MVYQHPHIYIGNTAEKGRGVFTSEIITKDTLIEICPVLYLPKKDIELLKQTVINDYYFEWGKNLEGGAFAMGYGSLYNHSFEPNAYYDVDMEAHLLMVYAWTNIPSGTEICFNYNGDPEDANELWFDTVK